MFVVVDVDVDVDAVVVDGDVATIGVGIGARGVIGGRGGRGRSESSGIHSATGAGVAFVTMTGPAVAAVAAGTFGSRMDIGRSHPVSSSHRSAMQHASHVVFPSRQSQTSTSSRKPLPQMPSPRGYEPLDLAEVQTAYSNLLSMNRGAQGGKWV